MYLLSIYCFLLGIQKNKILPMLFKKLLSNEQMVF